jgi:hypothetical protein
MQIKKKTIWIYKENIEGSIVVTIFWKIEDGNDHKEN